MTLSLCKTGAALRRANLLEQQYAETTLHQRQRRRAAHHTGACVRVGGTWCGRAGAPTTTTSKLMFKSALWTRINYTSQLCGGDGEVSELERRHAEPRRAARRKIRKHLPDNRAQLEPCKQ